MDSVISQFIGKFPPWVQWGTFFLFILIAVTPSLFAVYNLLFSKPILVSKINESYGSSGPYGNVLLFKISIVNIGKKNFYPKTWDAEIAYSEEDLHKVTLMPMRYLKMTIADINGNGVPSELKVNDIQYIQTYPILAKDQLISGYIAILDKGNNTNKNIDEIILKITDFKGMEKQIRIDYKNLRPEDLFNNDSIWEKVD